MNIEFYNCPPAAQFDVNILPKEKPLFIDYRPDFVAMEKLAKQFSQYENILLIGHGGSVTSFQAFYSALNWSGARTKKAYVLNTVDPDYITELKETLEQENTLVVAITKSGENTTQVEALSQFLQYPMLVITGSGSSVERIAEKMHYAVVAHPPVGGRFTAFTEVALLPALMCGLDIDGLYRGAREVYALYERDNLAWKAASALWQLEQLGYVDVLGLVYSHYLYPVSGLAVQLCHESFGKEGKGQTYTFAEGSEVQHHTLQRFLGGRKNMAGWFFGLHGFAHDLKVEFPAMVHSVELRGRALFDLNHVPLAESQRSELQGTLEDARLLNAPVLYTELSSLEPAEVGRLIAFWQLFAVYSSLLRKVNPFDQPEVENSKRISFNKRLAYKGLV